MLELHPEQIIAQIVLFVALWYFLKQTVFDRTLENLDYRASQTTGAVDEAEQLRAEAAALRATYENSMAAARREAAVAREGIRLQAEREEQQLVETARAEAAEALARVRETVAQEVEAARSSLATDVDALADRAAAVIARRDA